MAEMAMQDGQPPMAASQSLSATPQPAAEMATTAFMGLRIGPLNLLAAWGQASELLEMPKIYRLPGTPDSMRGLINLNGNVIPVFDIAQRYSLSHGDGTRPMLAVLERGSDAAAFVIDGLLSRLKFVAEEAIDLDLALGALPVEALQPLMTAAFHQNDEIWFVFDHRRYIHELIDHRNR